MNGDDDSAWESATWRGARRAQLRRALRLTVRERLQALEELDETSRHLAGMGRGDRPSGGPDPRAAQRSG